MEQDASWQEKTDRRIAEQDQALSCFVLPIDIEIWQRSSDEAMLFVCQNHGRTTT